MKTITIKKAKELIEPFIAPYINGNYCVIENVDPVSLLTWERFDLASKLLFIEDIKFNRIVNHEIYSEQINLLTLGSFKEPGDSSKNSLIKYQNTFRSIYSNMKKNGFNKNLTAIPISEQGSILNGAHRVACAIDLGINVKGIRVNAPPQILNYQFFKKRGASTKFLDKCSLQFINSSPNTYIALFWPIAKGNHKEIFQILEKIVYYKEIELSIDGLHSLLTVVYKNEPWLGAQNKNFPGAYGKLVHCFSERNPIRVIVFQSDSLKDVQNKKNQLRKLFGLEKHSVHINDTHEEAIRISKTIFNANGIHFFNHGKPNKNKETKNKIDSFKKYCIKNQLDLNDVAIDSGLTMELYGLRKSNDIDYLSIKKPKYVPKDYAESKISLHDGNELTHHGKSSENIIYDIESYFIYDDVKFVSLTQVMIMKMSRREKKDIVDVGLIKNLLEKENHLKYFILKVRSQLLFVKTRVFMSMINWMGYLGLYNFVRFIYRTIFKKNKLS